jgi:AraC-like DNA-binding protein
MRSRTHGSGGFRRAVVPEPSVSGVRLTCAIGLRRPIVRRCSPRTSHKCRPIYRATRRHSISCTPHIVRRTLVDPRARGLLGRERPWVARLGAGDLDAERARFAAGEICEHDTRPYRAFFGATVTFNARAGKVVYAESALLRPLPLRDARLAKLLAEHAEARLRCLPDVSTLVDQVRAQLRDDVAVGPPSLTRIATKLRMSERTLRRRLRATGENFRTLLDDVRQERALQLFTRATTASPTSRSSSASAMRRHSAARSGAGPAQRRLRAACVRNCVPSLHESLTTRGRCWVRE